MAFFPWKHNSQYSLSKSKKEHLRQRLRYLVDHIQKSNDEGRTVLFGEFKWKNHEISAYVEGICESVNDGCDISSRSSNITTEHSIDLYFIDYPSHVKVSILSSIAYFIRWSCRKLFWDDISLLQIQLWRLNSTADLYFYLSSRIPKYTYGIPALTNDVNSINQFSAHPTIGRQFFSFLILYFPKNINRYEIKINL